MLELILVIAIAAIGVFAVFASFSQASTGTAKAKAAKSQTEKRPKVQPKKTTKPAAGLDDAEIERLISTSAKSHSGMTTDRAKVVSLEEVTKKGKTAEATKVSTKDNVVTAKQRLIEAENGFAIVENRDKAATQKAKKEKARQKADRDADRALSDFFKAQDKKGRNTSPKFAEKEESPKTGGTVSMRKKITSDPTKYWGVAEE
jgi:type II secretory pathway pseudopilin PulG